MKTMRKTGAGISALLLLSACASTPMGPTVQVLPAPNKPFEVFAAEQATCKDYAAQQVSGQAERANVQGVGAAVVGTALGAAVGGAAAGGRGAGTGAAVGGTMGTVVGAGTSAEAERSIQAQYNNAYVQCMASKGNQVPGIGVRVVQPPPRVIYTAPPGTVYVPPSGAVVAPPPPPPPTQAPPPPGAGYGPPPGAIAAPPPPPPPPGAGQ